MASMYSTTPLQIFYESMINLEVISKSFTNPDDKSQVYVKSGGYCIVLYCIVLFVLYPGV